MLLKRLFERLLLRPADLEALARRLRGGRRFQSRGDRVEDEVILLVRVAERPRERRPGFTALPRWAPRRGPGGRLGLRRRAEARRSAGREAQGRRTGPTDVHLALAGGPLRRWTLGRGGHRHPLSARFGAGRIRRRGPADHGDRRPLLLHLCRGLAPWRGDGPGLDDRFPPTSSVTG